MDDLPAILVARLGRLGGGEHLQNAPPKTTRVVQQIQVLLVVNHRLVENRASAAGKTEHCWVSDDDWILMVVWYEK